MQLKDLLTIKQIEQKYGVKRDTLKSYITRKQVIPDDKKIKIDNLWFIDKQFAEEKWGNKQG